MPPIIDSDGHIHAPFYLFEEYMEKEYFSRRPRIMDIRGHKTDAGRWLVEGNLIPRVPFSRGVSAGGMRYEAPRHKQMNAKDNSLDDVTGRLKDMDLLGIDIQIVYPTALVGAVDIEDRGLAAAVCRAYNNYLADRCRKAPDRIKGIAIVPLQDPKAAAMETRRAVSELGMVGVTIPGMLGNRPLHDPEFLPFFEEVNKLDIPIGLHSVTGMHATPWADCFKDFFCTHITTMPFSMMVGLMCLIRSGLFETLPNLRVAFLEIGASWLPYWSWWVGKHVGERVKPQENWGIEPYRLPETVKDPSVYMREGRILTGFEAEENLRGVIDALGPQTLMYASDYPHADMEWNKVKTVKRMGNLTNDEKDAALGTNAKRFYNL